MTQDTYSKAKHNILKISARANGKYTMPVLQSSHIYVIFCHFFYAKFPGTAKVPTLIILDFSILCGTNLKKSSPKGMKIYIYIYIYMCVCVSSPTRQFLSSVMIRQCSHCPFTFKSTQNQITFFKY